MQDACVYLLHACMQCMCVLCMYSLDFRAVCFVRAIVCCVVLTCLLTPVCFVCLCGVMGAEPRCTSPSRLDCCVCSSFSSSPSPLCVPDTRWLAPFCPPNFDPYLRSRMPPRPCAFPARLLNSGCPDRDLRPARADRAGWADERKGRRVKCSTYICTHVQRYNLSILASRPLCAPEEVIPPLSFVEPPVPLPKFGSTCYGLV